MAFVLGHALYMKAIHGGKATHEKIDAHKMAVLLRGGMLPQAYVSPAERRATRDLLRRRLSCRRPRAALLTQVQPTNSPYNWPAIAQNIAEQATRAGVAARFPAPAIQQSIAGDLTRLGPYDQLRTALELSIVHTATEPNAQVFSRRRSLPGGGKILALVRL
jgi:hypothetical protein